MNDNRRIHFAIIGAERSGTTTLYEYLRQHPHICMSNIKEPGYFAFENDWRKNLNAYHELFSPKEGQLCGEASTMYTWFPEYPRTSKALHEYNPNLKIIYLIRNPLARMISQFSMWITWGVIKNDPKQLVNNQAFVNRSRYWLQLRQYLEYFPQCNIQILISEELFANPLDQLKHICKFLGLTDEGFVPEVVWENPTVGQKLDSWHFKKFKRRGWVQRLIPMIPSKTRAILRKLFERTMTEKPKLQSDLMQILWRLVESDVNEIERFIGRELTHWYPK